VAAPKNNNRCLIQVDFSVGFHFEEIDSRILFIGAHVAVIFVAYFPTDPGALMSAGKRFGAALIAWEAAAWCSTWHAVIPLVLARPSTSLNTWRTRLMASQGASRMRTTNLFSLAYSWMSR
jgi:hypothetical protein